MDTKEEITQFLRSKEFDPEDFQFRPFGDIQEYFGRDRFQLTGEESNLEDLSGDEETVLFFDRNFQKIFQYDRGKEPRIQEVAGPTP